MSLYQTLSPLSIDLIVRSPLSYIHCEAFRFDETFLLLYDQTCELFITGRSPRWEAVCFSHLIQSLLLLLPCFQGRRREQREVTLIVLSGFPCGWQLIRPLCPPSSLLLLVSVWSSHSGCVGDSLQASTFITAEPHQPREMFIKSLQFILTYFSFNRHTSTENSLIFLKTI